MYKIFPIVNFDKKRKRKITIGLSEENLEKKASDSVSDFHCLHYLLKL